MTGQLNRIFTDPWQKKVRTDNAKETFAELYAQRFGEEDYVELKRVREWIDSKDRAMMLAYLFTEDPYLATW